MVTSINEDIDTPDDLNNEYKHICAKVMDLQGEINSLKGKLAIKKLFKRIRYTTTSTDDRFKRE